MAAESFTPAESFLSPAVHHAQSIEDAIVMLDSRVPLTHTEKKLIVESLYHLAFREGARQGRQAGTEAVYSDIRALAARYRGNTAIEASRDDIAVILDTLLPPGEPREHTDPTVLIRENLTEKARQRDGRP